MSTMLLLMEETTLEEALDEKKPSGPRKGPILLASRATVAEALQALAKYHVLSAPLLFGSPSNPGDAQVLPRDSSGEPRDYLGVVDVTDLLFSLLAEISRDASAPLKRSEAEWKKTLLDVQGPFLGRQLFLAAGHGDGDEVFKSLFSTSLLEAVVAGGMSGGVGPLSYVREGRKRASDQCQSPGAPKPSGLRPRVNHRLAILDTAGAVVDVFSQSDLLRFVARRHERLGPLTDATVEELGLGSAGDRGLVCVADSTPTVEGFLRMREERVSAVAVLDDNGRLWGCLSPSDLRGLTEATLPLLALPCGQFIRRMRELRGEPEVPSSGAGAPRGVVQCTPSARFGEVVRLLCESRVHRVFVVEDGGDAQGARPLGVVSLTDVIRVVVSPESALVGVPERPPSEQPPEDWTIPQQARNPAASGERLGTWLDDTPAEVLSPL